MRRGGAALLALVLFLGATDVLVGQQDDPSEIFLKAYLSAQQGEKLEHENRFNTALAKYRFAGSLIAQLRRSHPGWQPAIVEYRGRKISEEILRTEERMTKQNALSASANPLPEVAPSLPESADWSEPGPDVVAPQSDGTVTQEWPVAAADDSRVAAEKQRDDTRAKFAEANEQITAFEHQRDEAFAQLRLVQGSEQGVRLLLAEKEDVQQKLANAEEKVRNLGESDPVNAKTFAEMNEQIAKLQEQLSESQKRNDYLTARAAELAVQLDDAGTELQVAKLAGANSEESDQLARENEL